MKDQGEMWRDTRLNEYNLCMEFADAFVRTFTTIQLFFSPLVASSISTRLIITEGRL